MAGALAFLGLALALHLGFALLALSQVRHWRGVLPRVPQPGPSTILLRISGYGLIGLALPIALWRDGPGFGPLLWACLMSVAACAVTITLSWRAHWLKPLARLAELSGRAAAAATTRRDMS